MSNVKRPNADERIDMEQPKREMSIQEMVDSLHAGHRARREYYELLKGTVANGAQRRILAVLHYLGTSPTGHTCGDDCWACRITRMLTDEATPECGVEVDTSAV